MKNCSYASEIVITPSQIICCKCTCQCGSQNSERTVCVHNLPLVYSLTLLLFRDLADHMIREVAACMRCELWKHQEWSADDNLVIKQNIILLSEAAGEQVDKHDLLTVSIADLLEDFLVGTEKRREWKKRTTEPPKVCELGPIVKMTFPSTKKQGAIQTKRRLHSDCDTEEQPPPATAAIMTTPADEEVGTFKPNYVFISLLITAAGCYSIQSKKYIGIRLLELRSQHDMNLMTAAQLTLLSHQCEAIWKELKQLTKKRSRRYTPKTKTAPQAPPVTASPLQQPEPMMSQLSEIANLNVTDPSPRPCKKKRYSMKCAKCQKQIYLPTHRASTSYPHIQLRIKMQIQH